MAPYNNSLQNIDSISYNCQTKNKKSYSVLEFNFFASNEENIKNLKKKFYNLIKSTETFSKDRHTFLSKVNFNRHSKDFFSFFWELFCFVSYDFLTSNPLLKMSSKLTADKTVLVSHCLLVCFYLPFCSTGFFSVFFHLSVHLFSLLKRGKPFGLQMLM